MRAFRCNIKRTTSSFALRAVVQEYDYSAILTLIDWVEHPIPRPFGIPQRHSSCKAVYRSQSYEIIDLVAMIGLGDGNKSAAGRLRNDVRRNLKAVFSSKTRDKLKNTEQRMAVSA